MARETSREIDAAAADWAARVDAGPLSAEENLRLEAWMSADTRRRGAFMRMRAIALGIELADAQSDVQGAASDVPVAAPDPSADVPGSSQRPVVDQVRRRFLWTGAAAVAACAVGVIGFGLGGSAQAYQTRRGETRAIALEDGSILTLNTSSKVSVRFSSVERRIELEEGEVLFQVAPDPSKPFVVDAGRTRVRALGTVFTVKRLGALPIEVLVSEGSVDVDRLAVSRSVRLAANMRIVATETPAPLSPARITPEEVRRELAWRTGQVAFEGETLTAAAAAFARYSDTLIIIDDPSVGREEITGLFAANDPVSFARAAALSLDLQARVSPGEVRLSR